MQGGEETNDLEDDERSKKQAWTAARSGDKITSLFWRKSKDSRPSTNRRYGSPYPCETPAVRIQSIISKPYLKMTSTTATNSKSSGSDTNSSTIPTKESFLVHGLEDVQPAYAEFDGQMYAGRLSANNGDRVGDTMFWMFEPTAQEVENTLVIWLNGGPGCSSFNCGVMMEHSPVTQPLRPAGYCCLQPTPDLEVNDHSWTKATTMLYVEHPWGTGFSYGKPEPATESEASGDMYAFLLSFFQVFPHLATYKLYIFGESYAGMFVPSILRYIHRENLKVLAGESTQPLIPIAGGAIVSKTISGFR